MELNNYQFPPLSSTSNTGSAVLNNPLDSKSFPNPLETSSKHSTSSKEVSYKQISNPLLTIPMQTQNQAFQQLNYMNNPLSSNFTMTNTFLPQSSFILNNSLMSKDPLQSNNLYANNKNINQNMINMNTMNVMNNTSFNNNNNANTKQNMKSYVIKSNNEKYNLTIECNKVYFYFKLEPANGLILSYYKGEYNLSTIINKMNVVVNNQNALEQINKIVEKSINDNSIKLIHDKLKKKMIIRFNKNNNDYSSDFELEEISNDKKLFNNIFEELNLLKLQQMQYMTLFKNNNFISNKDAINLINDNNIKNDFENKIKNIDSICDSQKKDLTNFKNEITNLKNEIKDINNNIKNADMNEIKTEINNTKIDLENKIKNFDLTEIKNEISTIKNNIDDNMKNINLSNTKNNLENNKNELDEIKNKINSIKDDFENRYKTINDEIINKINGVKVDFENKVNKINLDEVKNEINDTQKDLENKIKNVNLDEIKIQINDIQNNIDNKIRNINIDEIKLNINNIKNSLEDKFKTINLEEIKKEISELKSTFENKTKSLEITDNDNKTEINNLKNEMNNIKKDLGSKNEEEDIKNKLNTIENELSNIKTDISSLKENIDLKQEISKMKEEHINRENELKKEINQLKQEIEKRNSEKKDEKEIDNKLYEEINSLKQMNNQMKEDKIKLENEISELKSQLSSMIEKDNKKENEIRMIKEKNETKIKEQMMHKFVGKPEKLTKKYDILNTNNIYFIDEFAVYISITDNKEYLASGNKNNFNIDIYDIRNNIFYISLKAHNNGTPTVRYFLDEKKHKEYLLSADFLKTVIVWDINNDYNILLTIKNKEYKGSILSSILFFNIKIKDNEYNDYIITSTDDENDDFSKVYNFGDGSFLRNIPYTNKNLSYYLLPWEYNNNYYVIELCLNKISINNLLKDEEYAELVSAPESSHFGGFIYNTNFLCCSSENGQIRIWDLIEKKLVKKIETKGSFFFEIIPWNEKYLIAANYKNNSIDIFDIEKGELFKQISSTHSPGVRAVKKIYLPNHGESLITAGHDSVIKLWSI